VTGLDWSGNSSSSRATVGRDLEPCIHCGRGALLRHPLTRKPVHKVCEERHLAERAAAVAGGRGVAA
jgi:hypothetical protein